MSDLVEFLSNPRRWLQRRKDHKKIIAAARNMKGMGYCWPPRGGMEVHWMPGTLPRGVDAYRPVHPGSRGYDAGPDRTAELAPVTDLSAEHDEFAPLVELRIKLSALEGHGLGNGAVLILPADMWPGATAALDLRIVRADVPEPMLGLPREQAPVGDMSAEYGEFADLVELRIKLSRIVERGLGKGAMFILRVDTFAGATAAYGLPIVRADVPRPLLGLTDE